MQFLKIKIKAKKPCKQIIRALNKDRQITVLCSAIPELEATERNQ